MKRKTERKNKGITLIALIVTIIVLLILAGVTIATLTGDSRYHIKGKWSKIRNRKSRRRWIEKTNSVGGSYASKRI